MIRRNFFKLPTCLIFQALVFFIIPLELCGAEVSASEDRQDQIKQIETELSREKQKFDVFNSKEHDLLAQLADLEEEVAQKRHALEALKDKIRITRNEVNNLQEKLPVLERSLKSAEMRLSKRLVALYKYARRGYMKILSDIGNLDELWGRVKYLKAIMEDDRKVLTGLADEERKFKGEISLVKEKLNKKEAIKNKEIMLLSSLKKDLETKVVSLMKVHKEKEFYETAVKEVQLAANNLKKTMAHIEEKDTYEVKLASHFADFKSQLPVPLEGKIIKADMPLGPLGPNTQKGIFIEGYSDSRVRAVFPGRVDFYGRLKGYGEIVVINHGSRFFTISAQLSQRKKQEGEVVEGGEVIGLAGLNGPSKRPRLYFEVRRAGTNLDPLEWLQVR
jgi:septal ring factor EnvC (AmiA/AmiB activator)